MVHENNVTVFIVETMGEVLTEEIDDLDEVCK